MWLAKVWQWFRFELIFYCGISYVHYEKYKFARVLEVRVTFCDYSSIASVSLIPVLAIFTYEGKAPVLLEILVHYKSRKHPKDQIADIYNERSRRPREA